VVAVLINLVTDGAPALALGVDPADEGLMTRPPRPAGEGVITARMWRGIVFVGVVMAAGTLYVLDAALPGGFVEGTHDLPYAQTMAFTTLMLAQLFNTLNARSDERSAFAHLFTNRWLWAALGVSVALHLLVLYVPPLQRAFGTVPLGASDWARCVGVASTVLWLREVNKIVTRGTMRRFLVVASMCGGSGALAQANAQTSPDSVVRRLPSREIRTEYDSLTDSTTRSLSAYVVVDTSRTPPDTFAMELVQRWRGRGSVAPVGAVELGLGRSRLSGLAAARSLLSPYVGRPVLVFLLDGARRIRLPQAEYVSNAGATSTFETARYQLSSTDLRRIAEAATIRLWIGDRELWIDDAWRSVAAAMLAGQAPVPGLPVRKAP